MHRRANAGLRALHDLICVFGFRSGLTSPSGLVTSPEPTPNHKTSAVQSGRRELRRGTKQAGGIVNVGVS